MNIDTIISQIRTYAPVFGGRVAGAAEYALVQDQAWMECPCGYVVPLDDEPGPNLKLTGLQQVVTETFMVMCLLDNSTDRRGQAAATTAVSDVKTSLFSAVLNWRPPDINAAQGFRYARGGLVGDPNRARLWWQFDFSIDVTITDAEGFQIPTTPLDEIKASITDQTSGDPFATFVAANLQK
ncbi:hypothetical protein K6L44_08440 [Gluconacetobacter entanii]|uniref:phage tail terminator protein n=1 Tax=Gluconacetobacter entanii TaxID=108528 RepID=UPI001C9347EF|nr:hypothetical protein [Gluconacetobacter entanii]MBY4640013.1 hypothetical protein [Gluconacetobacter entanii]MCW4581245.1 hypothetical protein [Gluconacetobacter entanii]MCW4584505.1 hypothetical protein [Gluconacetobacter entanii]MCW4587831.1 hypothetical protein [Gluconacetobacter entanii]